MAVGGVHTLLLLDDGTVYGCGNNAEGQLGLGSGTTQVLVPTKIVALNLVTSISAGRSHSLFQSDNGLYVTGSNTYEQLCTSSGGGNNVVTPQRLVDISTLVVQSFQSTKYSSYILFKNGSVDSCGLNTYGQLGDGTNTNKVRADVKLNGKVTRLLGTGPSASSVFFYTVDKLVYGAGLNNVGQLGIGTDMNANIPRRVEFQRQIALDKLSASEDLTVALGTLGNTFQPTVSSLH